MPTQVSIGDNLAVVALNYRPLATILTANMATTKNHLILFNNHRHMEFHWYEAMHDVQILNDMAGYKIKAFRHANQIDFPEGGRLFFGVFARVDDHSKYQGLEFSSIDVSRCDKGPLAMMYLKLHIR